jgi:hypothetical protein
LVNWLFTTPTVAEAPFAWNPLHERFRIPRAISLVEVAPCEYREVRYDAYTNENDTIAAGLHYFRGGYEHIVDDATKACLIVSGLVTEDNFAPPPGTFGAGGFGEGGFGG